ncbi:hypothetical protein DH2020_020347 [Rehmannia glutinosa]|uniref:5'-3' DNA helicase ZGRF1-like N-terminal domain-containing protein n=1 Tax=Rehmannia glutinosa TaxID=99300 RepID=A0ABR0WI10_REHGL
MEDAQRWSVTYTKHVKQKRKVYQDGFLELQSSRHKVMLYDEWDKLLESRFVKKDDVIKSGETLAFDSYLVDIAELCRGHKPTSTVNSQEKDRKVSEKSGSSYSYCSQSNSISVDSVVRPKGRQEFKLDCLPQGYGLAKWPVKLYDTNRRHLDSRFLKKDEIVCSGESLALEGHLVEIGEQEGDHKPATDSTHQGKNGKVVGTAHIANHPAKIPTRKKFPAVHQMRFPGDTKEKPPDKTSPGKFTILNETSVKVENAKLSSRNPENEPRRAVHDILSILKQPILRKVVTMSKPSLEDHLGSHSSDVHSDIKDHIKECAEECSRSAREELREKASDHDSRIKVLKPEAVEVLVAAEKCTFSENERESQARSSSFCLGLGTANCMPPILNIECTDHKKSMSSPLSVEPHIPVTAALDSEGQTPIELATFSRSNENGEPANPAECEGELLWEDKGSSSRCQGAASSIGASNDYTSIDLSGVEEKTLKQDFSRKGMDEFPSFDLGF